MITLNKKIHNDLHYDGFCLIPRDELDIDIIETTKKLAEQILNLPQLSSFYSKNKIDNLSNLQEVISLINDKENNNEFTSQIYEMLPSLPLVYGLGSHSAFIDICFKAGLNMPVVGTTPNMRIDRPKSNYFNTPWHEDYWYSFYSKNSITMWIPFCNLNKDMGLLKIIPGSHKFSNKFKSFPDGHEPFQPVDPIDEKKAIDIEVPFGSILIFNQKLLHKSGVNNSDKCRITMQLRYNDQAQSDVISRSFSVVHSKYVLDNQKKIFNKN